MVADPSFTLVVRRNPGVRVLAGAEHSRKDLREGYDDQTQQRQRGDLRWRARAEYVRAGTAVNAGAAS